MTAAGKRIVVAGAGAVGSVTALAFARAGARVTLADPAPRGANASGIAAGMLAPALEAALDPLSHEHHDLFVRARDAWPGLVQGLGAGLDRCGALWFAAGSLEDEAVGDRLRSAGGEDLGAAQAQALSPRLTAPGSAVHLKGDWRLDPQAMLAAIHRGVADLGGTIVTGAVEGFEGGCVRMSGGATIDADALVVATGGPPAWLAEGLPELAVLRPIKGQILRLDGAAPRAGPIVRRGGTYIVPSADGPVVGATMEAGASDTSVDPVVIRRLRAEAAILFPDLADAVATPSAGVRYGAPDGLPLVGASSRPGVFLALGARRNGWLLAPLMAEAVVKAMAGTETEAFRPGRFD